MKIFQARSEHNEKSPFFKSQQSAIDFAKAMFGSNYYLYTYYLYD